MTAAPVHLVGSVPLPDAATVFRTLAAALGPLLSRIPDGEPGEHRRWIDDTALYLGLIHHDDREGDVARIRAASAVVPKFDVASECGWGRTDPERVASLLESHRVAARFLGAS